MDLERALISKVVSTGQVEVAIAKGLRTDLFADPDCADIFEHVLGHIRKYKTPPSVEAIQRHFPKFEWVPTSDALEYLCDEFTILCKKRFADQMNLELAHALDDPERSRQIDLEFLDVARQLTTLVPSIEVSRYSELDKRISEYEKQKEEGKPPGILFGFPTLDQRTGGVQAHELVSFQAFTNVGKSTALLRVAGNQFLAGHKILIFSLEMEASIIFRKLQAMIAGIDYQGMKHLRLDEKQMKKWHDHAKEMKDRAESEIFVIDKIRGATADHVFAEAVRHSPDVVIVDYVQMMRGRRDRQKWEQLEEVVYGLKENSRVLGIPHLLASQSTRAGGKEGATLDNVGGAIAINQASDIAIGLQQDEEMEEAEEMEWRILKNRDGPRGSFVCQWQHGPMIYRERTLRDVFGQGRKERILDKKEAGGDPQRAVFSKEALIKSQIDKNKGVKPVTRPRPRPRAARPNPLKKAA